MQEKNSEESTENFLEEDFQEKLEKNDADSDEKVEADLQDSKSEEEPSIEDLLEERDSLKDRLMRSLADTENLRKRAERDRKDAELYGGTKLARDLISVHDNLCRALENIDDELRGSSEALVEGLELTQRELLAVFSKHKIEQILPSIGDKFDPKIHQAMFEAPVLKSEKGSIIQVMTNGFKIGDRLLRASQVGVSSGSGSLEEPDLDQPSSSQDDKKEMEPEDK